MKPAPADGAPHFAFTDPPAPPPGVQLIRLENGLHIILCEDHSAPVVSVQAWAMTGSMHEGKWLGAGLSHILEHMLFKGTRTRDGARIEQEIQAVGGYINAYTSFDRTVYWINAPSSGVAVALDVLCDVMQNATLPEDELAREMSVIRREMDMCEDDPHLRSSRRLFEVAYTRSPCRFPVIGCPDIFELLKPADIREYYHERYVPNNIFFVVVGDINPEAVEAQIRQAFAGTKGKPLPQVYIPDEPKQVAPREVAEEAPIELGHVHFSWHIPDLRHPDVPLLDVLAVVLGAGRSSRLFQQVREKKGLVNSVEAWTFNPGYPGLFGISAVVDAAKFEPARRAMLEEIERLKSEFIPEAEVKKAVKQFIAAQLSTRKTMQGQANDLGHCWLAANDLSFSARYLEAVKRATPEELQRVARLYLTPENRTIYALLPRGHAPKPSLLIKAAVEKPIQKFELPNGLRLLIKEDHRLPFVEFRVVLRGGVLAETVETNGITNLLAKMLLQGTITRTGEQIAAEIESVGGSLDTFAGNNSFGISAEVMHEDFKLGLELVADVLLRPSFPSEPLERERAIQLAAIAAQRDDLLRSAMLLLRRTMFGPQGYGLDALGTEQSVARLSRDDLAAFHSSLTVPSNCVVAIYGDIDTGVARAAAEEAFRHWRPGMVPQGLVTPSTSIEPARGRRVTEHRDKKQAVVVVGFPGTTLLSEDRFALQLVEESCSDIGSRLFMRIREKLGLAYYTGATNLIGIAPGFFAFYAGTEPAHAEVVEAEMFKEAAALCTDGLDADELERVKAKLIGQKKISRQDLGGFAMATALDELYGLGYTNQDTEDEKFKAVTCERIRAVAQKYLRHEYAVVATVRP
ncbi:MAG: insulinase family protein [Verrucomicrobiae bacterium]|nr:insulinase family protein [Verrucomicrobiae bacterium]